MRLQDGPQPDGSFVSSTGPGVGPIREQETPIELLLISMEEQLDRLERAMNVYLQKTESVRIPNQMSPAHPSKEEIEVSPLEESLIRLERNMAILATRLEIATEAVRL